MDTSLPVARQVHTPSLALPVIPEHARMPTPPVDSIDVRRIIAQIGIVHSPALPICKTCRRPFLREEGCPKTHAKYHRCENCRTYKNCMEDSCTIT